jgi:hypothetical protein
MNAPVRHLLPIDQVSDLLAGRIDSLVRELLPLGQRHGGEWQEASRSRGGLGDGLSVRISGGDAGVWKHFGEGHGGDALDLVAYVLFRGDKRQALRWAARWLGLDSGDPAALATARRQAAAISAASAEQAAAEAEKKRKLAHRNWLAAQPQIAGTPVEYYLAGRGIDLASLGRQPGAIRFAPAAWYDEARPALPAMVAAIGGGEDGGFMACHTTYLEQAGPGDWRKARLDPPKKVLGAYAGGCISLWRGASGRALRQAVDGEVVDITEGIEDGLSVAMAFPDARVIAAVSLSNLGQIVLPPAITGACIWRQADTHPRTIDAYDRARTALLRRGLQVFEPPLPAGVKDVNELLQRASA